MLNRNLWALQQNTAKGSNTGFTNMKEKKCKRPA